MTTDPEPMAGKQLLVVEDDRLVLAMLVEGLSDAGFVVVTSESVEDAEAWLSGGGRPDLAVLDVRLAGQDGLYLAQRLRDLDHIPFMMLSAYSDPQTVARATAAGALGYAVKPQDLAQLVPAIQAALARADELQDLRTKRLQLQAALNGERDINIAVGITMMQNHLKRSEAFELIRMSARKQRRKLADLAAQIIQAGETLSL